MSVAGSMGGVLEPTLHYSPWFWLTIPILGLISFYTIILVHCCAHNHLTSSRAVNRVIGEVLSALNVFQFTEFRALHFLHHTRTNRPGEDPHHVREGESWLRYVVTHYARMCAFTYTEYYRRACWKKDWEGVDMTTRRMRWHDRYAMIMAFSGRRIHPLWELILLPPMGILAALVASGYFLWGSAWGLFYTFSLLIVPLLIGQILVADFNYRGHVGMPVRDTRKKGYDGSDTLSYYDGIWRFINWATFGFYHHREHHIDMDKCMFVQRDVEVQADQETQIQALMKMTG